MNTHSTSNDRPLFIALVSAALLLGFAGFAPSYYLKLWFGTPPLEFWVHVHAVLFTAWLILLLVQSSLIRMGKHALHARLGKWGVAVAALMVVTAAVVILQKPRLTDASRAFIFTPLLSLVMFSVMVALAIRLRRNAATHKRLMLLATALFMGAPITRLMMMVGIAPGPYLHHGLTYGVLLLPLVVHDLRRFGRLHPATLWGGLFLLLRHPLQGLIAHTDTWQRIAAAITA
jgi:hypothetical protein